MCESQLDEEDLKQSHFKEQQPLSRHLFLCHCTKQRQAIINAQFPTIELVPAPFHAQEKEALAHHRGLVSLRISDGKFVNHTTEMIL